MPKVSVVIPTYNRTQYLAYSLYLYTRQTMKDFEIIVIDDGSTDGDLSVADLCGGMVHMLNGLNIRCFRSERKKSPIYESSGPLINFAVKNVADSDIIIYSDPEVMPFPTFVENHYKSHIPGSTFLHTEVGTETPVAFGNTVVDEDGKCFVRGLTLKMWKEHSHTFGTIEEWFANESLCDIEKFWDAAWEKIHKLPKSYLGDPNKGYSYPDGEQHFWGFQGSQAGLSFSKDVFMNLGGWNEEISIPGRWAGEDGELVGRIIKAGIPSITNDNIKAVHLYHPKPPAYSDADRKKFIVSKNEDPNHRVANVGSVWGDQEQLKIMEIKL